MRSVCRCLSVCASPLLGSRPLSPLSRLGWRRPRSPSVTKDRQQSRRLSTALDCFRNDLGTRRAARRETRAGLLKEVRQGSARFHMTPPGKANRGGRSDCFTVLPVIRFSCPRCAACHPSSPALGGYGMREEKLPLLKKGRDCDGEGRGSKKALTRQACLATLPLPL